MQASVELNKYFQIASNHPSPLCLPISLSPPSRVLPQHLCSQHCLRHQPLYYILSAWLILWRFSFQIQSAYTAPITHFNLLPWPEDGAACGEIRASKWLLEDRKRRHGTPKRKREKERGRERGGEWKGRREVGGVGQERHGEWKWCVLLKRDGKVNTEESGRAGGGEDGGVRLCIKVASLCSSVCKVKSKGNKTD